MPVRALWAGPSIPPPSKETFMKNGFSDPHDVLRRAGDQLLLRQLALTLKGGRAKRPRPPQLVALRPYPALPPLRPKVIADPGLPTGAPPPGWAVLYEIGASPADAPVYVGVTRRGLRDRFAGHLSAARHRRGKNCPLEAWLRRRAERGETVVIRAIGLHKGEEATKAAERARIAERRAELGARLLNQGPGGETAPAGRLVPEEERERARVARRAHQRMAGYRRHQSLVSTLRRHAPAALEALLDGFSRAGAEVTMRDLCRGHGVSETVLLSLLDGTANALIVDPEALALARAAQARREALRAANWAKTSAAVASSLRAYLAAPAGTALADIARERGFDAKRLQEIVRRRQQGVPDDLARAVRARMNEDARHRLQARCWETARLRRRELRWLLTAYARPGSVLTLAAIAARLGITQGAVSHALAGRQGRPLPRRLLRACRERARTARYAARRGGGRA
jgi:hypothetical protein